MKQQANNYMYISFNTTHWDLSRPSRLVQVGDLHDKII